MELTFLETFNTPIVIHGDIQVIARLRNIILDPETGDIIGIQINKLGKVISAIDIVKWRKDIIIINQADAIVDEQDILRIDTVLGSGLRFYRNRVVTEDKEYLGKAIDYSFDSKQFKILKLLVQKRFLFFFTHKYVIPASDIIEVRKRKIIIKNRLRKVKDNAEEKERVTVTA